MLHHFRRIYRTVSESAVNELAEMQTGALSSGELSDASDGDSISSFGSSGDLLDARARSRRRRKSLLSFPISNKIRIPHACPVPTNFC